MSTGIILAFAAMFFWGIHDTLLKPLTGRFHPISLAFYKGIPDVILLFFIFIFFGLSFPITITAWVYILLFGIIGTAGYYTFLRAIENGLVSLSVPIAHAYIIITAVLSAFLLGEVLSIPQYLGIFLVMVGVFLLSQNPRELKKLKFNIANKGVKYALLTVGFWGVLYVVMKFMIIELGAMASAFYGDLSILFFMLIAYIISKQSFSKDKKHLSDTKTLVIFCFAVVVGVLATITMMISASLEKVAISMGIVSATPIVVVIVSFIFLKERMNYFQYASIVVLTMGMVLLSVY